MTKFSWCFGPEGAVIHHDQCPGEIGGPDGLHCSCPCHSPAIVKSED